MKNIFVVGAALLSSLTLATGCSSSRCHGTACGTGGNFDLSGGMNTNPDFDVIGPDGGVIIPPQGDGGTEMTHDPTTCTEAATSKSYIGCDYWPTVTANAVWNVFDYAVVVSNPGTAMANISVTGGSGAITNPKTVQVAPGALVKIGLPWVATLKGPQADGDGEAQPITASVFAAGGAYHLTSDIPVLVYQFNALEYKAGTGNDLQGVAWSTCPNDTSEVPACDSYSNDASLLLPSTAMTDNYIITGLPGDDYIEYDSGSPVTTAYGASYATVTATADNTTVTMQLSKTANILASTDAKIAAASASAKVTYTLSAGDVIELFTSNGSKFDLTGTIVQSTSPVQVIVGNPCTTNPTNNDNPFSLTPGPYTCDHVEETVLPVETWGKAYVVTAPTGPEGNNPGHVVRIYGGVAAVTLTYAPAVAGAPTTVAAGAVASFQTTTDFSVTGDQPFLVSSEQLSGQLADPIPTGDAQQGDPALSFLTAVEQWRDKYLFLAPTDYTTSYVDTVVVTGTTLMLDNATVTTKATAIGGNYSVLRIPLTAGSADGAHTLTGTAPFGIQVLGYGDYTSYQYPGGLDLKVISSAPPPIQ